MANQYVNKVEYGSDTLIDLTSDTVTASTLLSGYTAHDRSGAPIVGVAVSGGYTVNFSTTNPDLYGATITIKQGSTVIGTVAFDNTGSASYTLSNPGTYTWSVTLEGETYTDTFVVAAPEVYIETTFVYRDWLVAGGLNPSDYADLAAVLADEEAVRKLMTIHAAVDYLASFEATDASVVTILNDNYAAKWISLTDYAMDTLEAAYGTLMVTIGKYGYGEWGITDATTTPPTWGALGNVPVMTSNTAPYGEASASSNYSSSSDYSAFHVFEDTVACWYASPSDNSPWIQIKYINPVCAKRIYVYGLRQYMYGTWDVVASNDGSTWSASLGSVSFTTVTTDQVKTVELTNNNYYLYYRLKRTSGSNQGGYGAICKRIQFYGRALKVSVPKMSGNTTPYGEVIASSYYDATYLPVHAFDDNASTVWQNAASENDKLNTAWVGYEFEHPVVITHALYTYGTYPAVSVEYRVIARNSSSEEWQEISAVATDQTKQTNVIEITNPQPYKQYAIRGSCDRTSARYCMFYKVQFYGKDYSEREWDTTHPRRYLYDHGVEVETLTLTNTNANATGEKRADDVYLKKTGTNNMSAITASLDLSSCSLCRAKIGNIAQAGYSGGVIGRIDVLNSLTWNSSDTFVDATYAINDGDGNMPYDLSLDVSNINQTRYVGMSVRSAGDYTFIITMTELWLE